MKSTLVVAATLSVIVASVDAGVLKTNCATMRPLAQEHSNDMARRDSLDHARATPGGL
jgi:uncharacterized protein YkwD